MIETRTPRGRVAAVDQAAGLRRLFAQPTAPLLPVLTGGAAAGQTGWLMRLAEAFARTGQRTVLVDAARAQVAAAFGLRARYDLWHAFAGQCTAEAVQLDAAPGLTVVPAARACESAVEARIALDDVLAPILARPTDQILLLLPPAQARLLPASEVLVPVTATRDAVAAALVAIRRASELAGNLTFRLLFLAMENDAAATLASRMSASIGVRSKAVVRFGAAVPVARDLEQAVAAASGWQLASIRRPQGRSVTEK